jgi:hypothetical protein
VSDLVFGYGALVTDLEGAAAELKGFRRCWGVAMDNSRTIPGYKYYVDENGSRPDVYVAYLDIQPDPAASVNGACIPVEPEELRALDDRERSYTRTEVTDAIEGPSGRVWTYVGSDDGRRRLSIGRESGRGVISREYLDRVEAGFRALGPDHHAAFRESFDSDGLPIRELIRVDLPG